MARAVDRFRPNSKLSVEPLENRALMSAVTTSLSGGNLTITGDNYNDYVEIRQIDSDSFTVKGLYGTTVNGVGWTPVQIDGVTRDITFYGNGGNDDLYAMGVSVGDDLNFLGGSGYDELLGNGLITGGTSSDGRGWIADFEEVDINGGHFRYDLVIKNETAWGNAPNYAVDVDLHHVYAGNNGLTITTSPGDDVIRLDEVTVAGNANIQTGGRNDYIDIRNSAFGGVLDVEGGTGTDKLVLLGVEAYGIALEGGTEEDVLKLGEWDANYLINQW